MPSDVSNNKNLDGIRKKKKKRWHTLQPQIIIAAPAHSLSLPGIHMPDFSGTKTIILEPETSPTFFMDTAKIPTAISGRGLYLSWGASSEAGAVFVVAPFTFLHSMCLDMNGLYFYHLLQEILV
ncbi:hypothetical protein CEXT_143991 [Caerostris extrusa]|uniref:Uncharacterized protein n=1 Tax=Caerostris extrusa TaxID=172846 RepID=A0AAV4NXA2_CAEEX|nr:hypothetical protein CEXT_143991 [Caerostris extrusa]